MKICKKCSIEKSYSSFYKKPNSKDGYQYVCISCYLKDKKEYREKLGNIYRERHRQWAKRHREKNKDTYKKIYDNFYKKHRESILIKNKTIYKTHKKARNILRQKLLNGSIIRPNICSLCKQEKTIQAHHPDYTNPIEVIWLCIDCHGLQHLKHNSTNSLSHIENVDNLSASSPRPM